MVRAIQTGVGWFGIKYVTTFTRGVPDIEMVGFVARSDKSKARLADAGVAPDRIFPSLAEAARATGAELVINATKTPEHYPLIKEALGLGLHVLTEKPFASTVAEAKELVDLAAGKSLFLGVAENYRYDPAPIEAHRLIRAKHFGAPTRVSVYFRKNLRTFGYPYPYPEIAHPVLSDYGIHIFHLMRWLLADEPVRIFAVAWTRPDTGLAGPPAALVTVEFASGIFATLDGSYISTGPETAWDGEWSMEFEDGEIWWTGRDGADRVILRALGGEEEELPLAAPKHPDAAGAVHAIVEAIKTGTPGDDFIPGSDNIRSLAISEAAILSAARRGEWVDMAEILG